MSIISGKSSRTRSTILPGAFQIVGPSSPLKMTAEKMQMQRRDVKPGNGVSLMSYKNYFNMKKNLAEMRPMIDDWAGDHYISEKVAAPERYVHTRKREIDELRKENNRLFGRLLNIYEVSEEHCLGTPLCGILGSTVFWCRKNRIQSESTSQARWPRSRTRSR